VHLSGIASVTGITYEMWDMFGPFDESVRKTAFDNTLAAEPDVAFLVNHKGLTMARTIAMPGKQPTLLLGMRSGTKPEDNGLGMDSYVNPRRTDVTDLVTAVDDGQITEMSFAFMIVEGYWSEDFMSFEIAEVDIDRGDVSAVNYGANPYTSIEGRQQEILDEVRMLPAGAAEAAFRELAARADVDLDILYHAYMSGAGSDRAATPPPAAPAQTTDPLQSRTYWDAYAASLDA
jgi:HK97 family phage prohead protease